MEQQTIIIKEDNVPLYHSPVLWSGILGPILATILGILLTKWIRNKRSGKN